MLTRAGVRVRLFAELLAETLAVEGVCDELLAQTVTADVVGVELVDRVRSFLAGLPPTELATRLIGGVTVDEVPGASAGFVGGLLGDAALLVPPLPNTVFTRDPSVHLGTGVLLAAFRRTARRNEPRLWRAVYAHHPELGGARTWYGADARDYGPATLEGGDVLILSERCIAVGVSERTHPVAVENLAAALFAADVVDRVLAVELPKGRGTMHLDTVMTVVDVDKIVLWPRARDLRVHRIEPGAGGRMRVREEPELVRAVAAGMGRDRISVVTTGEDEVLADREQWDDGNNTLALSPGVVVAYERNVVTNRRLREAGVEVRTVPASELPRGRGGPRCMSCPVARDPLPA